MIATAPDDIRRLWATAAELKACLSLKRVASDCSFLTNYSRVIICVVIFDGKKETLLIVNPGTVETICVEYQKITVHGSNGTSEVLTPEEFR